MRFSVSFALACSAFITQLSMTEPTKADDWGCKVLLCLANPGSPTEYAECVAPITKLYRHLAKGGGFPTCSGAGFKSSRPGFQPYECEAGYKLASSREDTGRTRLTCQATAFTRLPARDCGRRSEAHSRGTLQRIDGQLVCGMYRQKQPTKRDKPHYVDVTIEGSGTRRVWY